MKILLKKKGTKIWRKSKRKITEKVEAEKKGRNDTNI